MGATQECVAASARARWWTAERRQGWLMVVCEEYRDTIIELEARRSGWVRTETDGCRPLLAPQVTRARVSTVTILPNDIRVELDGQGQRRFVIHPIYIDC